MNSLVTIASYQQAKTAYFLKDKLEDENIECNFSFLNVIDLSAEDIKVQVKTADVEDAIKVMFQLKDEYGMNIEDIEPGKQFKRIIVPTGFSKGSENAAFFAVHLAEKIGAEIKLLHVYDNPVTDISIKETATYQEFMLTAIKDAEENAKNEISNFKKILEEYIADKNINNIRLHSCIVKGSTVERIKLIAEKYDPDLIVMGTAGKTDKADSILAGLSNEIVKGLNTPLFAIHGRISPDVFEKANILYASDFNERDHNSLENLLQITNGLSRNITCVHVDTEYSVAKEDRMDELNAQLQKDYSKENIICTLIDDYDIVRGITNYAENSKTNMLSFTLRKKNIFDKLFKPNLFKKILQEANMPILIFPS